MLRKSILLIILIGLLATWVACSGSTTVNNPPPPGSAGSAPLSIAVRDTPPAGVTVLSFEITVTGAVLQPGNVSLITTPIEIEITRLQVETAFFNNINIPAGTYTSIAVTFSNPELTILNNSGSTIAGCANGAVCELRPPLSSATVTYSGAPFPLTVAANTPLGLLLDFDLLNSIPTNLASLTPTISFSQLQAAQGTGVLEEIEDVIGRIVAVRPASNEFDLQTADGRTLTGIRWDMNTEFDDFSDVNCAANNATCLMVGQIVELDLHLLAGGMLLAKEIEAEDDDLEEELEGIIVSIANLPAQFEMVLMHESLNVVSLDVGQRVLVNLQNPRFRIDDDDLPANSNDFDSTFDLMVGQTVQVERISGPTGMPPVIATDKVKLKGSRLTATVQSPPDLTNNLFFLTNLPSILTAQTPPVTQLEVRVTPGETDFKNVSGLSAIAAGDTVSVRGLLFKGMTGTPFMLAMRVRKR